jgi:hypothetical protein
MRDEVPMRLLQSLRPGLQAVSRGAPRFEQGRSPAEWVPDGPAIATVTMIERAERPSKRPLRKLPLALTRVLGADCALCHGVGCSTCAGTGLA